MCHAQFISVVEIETDGSWQSFVSSLGAPSAGCKAGALQEQHWRNLDSLIRLFKGHHVAGAHSAGYECVSSCTSVEECHSRVLQTGYSPFPCGDSIVRWSAPF